MSYEIRISLFDGIDRRVYREWRLGGDGDYRVIPKLLDRAYESAREELGSVGSFAIVHGYAYGAERSAGGASTAPESEAN